MRQEKLNRCSRPNETGVGAWLKARAAEEEQEGGCRKREGSSATHASAACTSETAPTDTAARSRCSSRAPASSSHTPRSSRLRTPLPSTPPFSPPTAHLAVSAKREGVESLLHTASRGTLCGVLASLALQSSALLSSRRQSAQLSVLHHRLADPVDARIVADGGVVRVDEDHLEVLVRRVGVDPVGVEHAQVAAAAAHALLGLRAEGALPESSQTQAAQQTGVSDQTKRENYAGGPWRERRQQGRGIAAAFEAHSHSPNAPGLLPTLQFAPFFTYHLS